MTIELGDRLIERLALAEATQLALTLRKYLSARGLQDTDFGRITAQIVLRLTFLGLRQTHLSDSERTQMTLEHQQLAQFLGQNPYQAANDSQFHPPS